MTRAPDLYALTDNGETRRDRLVREWGAGVPINTLRDHLAVSQKYVYLWIEELGLPARDMTLWKSRPHPNRRNYLELRSDGRTTEEWVIADALAGHTATAIARRISEDGGEFGRKSVKGKINDLRYRKIKHLTGDQPLIPAVARYWRQKLIGEATEYMRRRGRSHCELQDLADSADLLVDNHMTLHAAAINAVYLELLAHE